MASRISVCRPDELYPQAAAFSTAVVASRFWRKDVAIGNGFEQTGLERKTLRLAAIIWHPAIL
jgi:hypothetical protein